MRIYEQMAIGATSGTLKRRPSADVRCRRPTASYATGCGIRCRCPQGRMPSPWHTMIFAWCPPAVWEMSGRIFASPPMIWGMYRDIVETRLFASLHVIDRPSRLLSLHRACRGGYLRLHRMPMHGGRPRVRCGETRIRLSTLGAAVYVDCRACCNSYCARFALSLPRRACMCRLRHRTIWINV